MDRVNPAPSRRKGGSLGALLSWYFDSFPIWRGKGLVNRLLGRFLVITVEDGIKLRLTNPLEFNQRRLLSGATSYEPEVSAVITKAVLPGMVVADVGANLGFHSLLASKRVGRDGEVHSFEPSPAQFRHLTLNLRLNRAANVRANNLALADQAGVRTLFLSIGWNQGTHSLGETADSSVACPVACTTLDAYVRDRHLTRLDVVKADVEGAEPLMLAGATQTLKTLRPGLILVEADEGYCRALGTSTRELKACLQSHGYELYRLFPSKRPQPTNADFSEEHANLAALHVAASEHFRLALLG